MKIRQTIRRRLSGHRPQQTHNARWVPGPEWRGASEFVDDGSHTPVLPPGPVSKLATGEVDEHLLKAVVSLLALKDALPVQADPVAEAG